MSTPSRRVSLARASAREVRDALDSGALDDALELDLSDCALDELPESIGRARGLMFLNCGGNNLRALPASFGELRELRRAFFLGNAFEEVPEVLGTLPRLFMLSFKSCAVRTVSERALAPSLGWLILSDNRIERLPESLGSCLPMRKLMLAGNALRELPESMKNLRNLELLRVADNRFETIPSWVLELPKLSWFAAAANPVTDPVADEAKSRADHLEGMPSARWEELGVADDAKALGQGTSGDVYAGTWRGEKVAVKVYKNEAKTSDGRPEDEMTASILAAAIKSEGTVKTIGRFTRGASRGLVMEFLDHDAWKNLGKPPNFETVARDTYDVDVTFSAREITAIARDIGSALAELHALGVAHGDVYAHNILYIRESSGLPPRAKLGDFGAGWFYDTKSPDARAIELNEVRAFGAILEETCARHDGVSGRAAVLALAALADRLLGDRDRRLPFITTLDRIHEIERDFPI